LSSAVSKRQRDNVNPTAAPKAAKASACEWKAAAVAIQRQDIERIECVFAAA
jgi:hypothetical protein